RHQPRRRAHRVLLARRSACRPQTPGHHGRSERPDPFGQRPGSGSERAAAMNARSNRWSKRRGLSLLEVLIALTIFLLGMIAIGQLVIMAGDRAVEVKLESQATQLCQSKLAEIVSGAVPLSAQGEVPFDEAPDWQWSLEAEQANVSGLWQVKVRVSRQQPDGTKIECA